MTKRKFTSWSETWAIKEAMKSNVSTAARLVLIMAAWYAVHGTGRNIHPSASTLAKATGMHRTTVTKALRELVEARLLIPDGTYYRGVRRYRLSMQRVAETDTSGHRRPPVAETDRSDTTGPSSCRSALHNHLCNEEEVEAPASANSGAEDREGVEERRAALIAGQAVVVNPTAGHADAELVAWAMERELLVNVDRPTRWANPYRSPMDGNRDRVVDRYREELLPNEPKLLERLPELRGKALGCRCYPRRSHADVLAELANALAPTKEPGP